MTEQINGIASESDIQSLEDAATLLDVYPDASDDEIDEAVNELFLDAHPDSGGTEDLFKAVDSAAEVLKGNIGVPPDAAESQRSDPRGSISDSPRSTSSRQQPGEGPSTPDRDVIKEAIFEKLQGQWTTQRVQDTYGVDITLADFVDVLTDLVLLGSIQLSDIDSIIGGDENFSSASRDSRFGSTGSYGGSNYSSGSYGDDRFGR